ncbi:MAG: hypothetical protein ABI882_03240 [Acidobacteriota bacterium]
MIMELRQRKRCGQGIGKSRHALSPVSLTVIVAVCLLLTSFSMSGQEPPRDKRRAEPGPPRGEGQGSGFGPERGGPQGPPRDGPGYNFLSAEMRFEGRVVKGAPYAATAVTENIQTLADGTRISRKSEAIVARDSEGRTRREQKIVINGPFAPSGEPPTRIFINDVVAKTNYELDPQSRTARRMRPPPDGGPPPMGGPPPGPSEVTNEVIGKQTIEGIEAEGRRSTITIPVGSIGNDRPIVIVSERWESTELQTVVLSKHRDPRFGEIVFRLTGISRTEPPRTLFEVPADYHVVEGGPPHMRGGPGQGPGPRRPPQD